MRCSNVRQTLSEARYQNGVLEPSIAAHLAQCHACQQFHQAASRLDAFLALDEPVSPRPGFDTRFFARLSELRKENARPEERGHYSLANLVRSWRWLLGGVTLTSAAVIIALWARPSDKPVNASRELVPLTAQELALARDLELVQDLDLVRHLQDVETYEVLAQLDIKDIEKAASQLEPSGASHAERGVAR
jgi:hypothetical protein